MSLSVSLSQRRICGLLQLNRSSLWRVERDLQSQQGKRNSKVVNLDSARARKTLVEAVQKVIKQHPTWGYRRVRAWLVRREGFTVSKKTVQRIMQDNGWQVRNRRQTPRPRVQVSASKASVPNERWVIDATSCWSKQGWIGIMAVIDCCTRQIVGLHVSQRGRAQEAEAALEQECLEQFGLLFAKPGEHRPVLRSDKAKVFTSGRFGGR